MNEIPVSKREIWFADSGTVRPFEYWAFLWPNGIKINKVEYVEQKKSYLKFLFNFRKWKLYIF